MTQRPLDGITVIEISNWVQGPLAGQLLVNMGARVIKIEQPERGDPSRGLQTLYGAKLIDDDGRALLWELCNRGKQSICLDMRGEAGRAVAHELVRSADVFITNLQRETLEVFRCTSEELLGVNPKLIYGLGGGLTTNGPLSNAPAQDTVAMAYSGLMLTTGSASGEPAYPPGALADVNAATSLASGITTALLGRERNSTGGQVVTTSLVQATAWLQMLGIAVPANTGQRLRPFERGKTANPMMSIYQASDGRWVALGIVSLSRRPWQALLEAIERTEWFETTEWGDSAANRSRSAEEIAVALQERFLERPGREWIARLQEFDIPCSLVNHPSELADDENMVADNLVATGPDGLRFVSGPFAINGLSGEHTAPAPALGQDTQAVLESMGRTPDEIAALFESGAAW